MKKRVIKLKESDIKRMAARVLAETSVGEKLASADFDENDEMSEVENTILDDWTVGEFVDKYMSDISTETDGISFQEMMKAVVDNELGVESPIRDDNEEDYRDEDENI